MLSRTRNPGGRAAQRRLLALATCALAALTAAPPAAQAAPGGLDPSFGHGGLAGARLKLGGGRYMGGGTQIARQRDGKLIVAGPVGGPRYAQLPLAVARFTPRGRLDRSFGTRGRTLLSFPKPLVGGSPTAFRIASIVVQPNGRIVLAGTGSASSQGTIPSPGQFAVTRLRANGKLDRSFGTRGWATGKAGPVGPPSAFDPDMAMRVLTREPDGHLLAAGTVLEGSTQGTIRRFAFMRLDANGAPDAGVGAGGLRYSPSDLIVLAMVALPDGRIEAIGAPDGQPTPDALGVNRFLAVGTPDTSFGTAGSVLLDVSSPFDFRAAAVTADGGVIVGGSGLRMIRLDSNGALDPSFGRGCPAPPAGISADLVVPHGDAIVAAGTKGRSGGRIVRFTANGCFNTAAPVSRVKGVLCGNGIDGRRVVLSGTSEKRLLAIRLVR